MAMMTGDVEYDRAKEVKQFDESKMGVKGLLDSGLTTIPKMFIHPPETLANLKPASRTRPDSSIPIIDLSGLRSAVVDQISRAARELGFFQVINHGIPSKTMDRTIAAVKAFHEQLAEVKARFYSRDMSRGCWYFSNVDLYHSKAAGWRDTVHVKFGPNPPAPEELPEVCGREMVDWDNEVQQLAERLMGLISEGLGLGTDRLKELTCSETRVMGGQYYPHCPQPDLTVGINSHTDAGLLTVLIQDQIGGLQVKYGEDWLDVKPVPGAVVINGGDLLQIMTNNEYKSVIHRVLANSSSKPRISVVTFLVPGRSEELYGPLPELVSLEKPALFRQFTLSEYMGKYFSKQLNGKTLIDYYKL